MLDGAIRLPIPQSWPAADKRAFTQFARRVGAGAVPASHRGISCGRDATESAGLAAASRVLSDLVGQGWTVSVADGTVELQPPPAELDSAAEKRRVRLQELVRRDEQLSRPSVRRFVADMERPREYLGRFVSIFSLMRDGAELADSLSRAAASGAWRDAVDPYLQVVSTGERCPHTGLKLVDIWRYFRHTWTNQYTSTPGRTLMLLVRDRAAAYHPIVGIAALGSPIVQIRERDEWIGWQPNTFLNELDRAPDAAVAKWAMKRLDLALAELYVEDLVADGLYWPEMWQRPSSEAVARLLQEASDRRRDHHRFVRGSDLKQARDSSDAEVWRKRAESELFRSKRCLALADLLRARSALLPFLDPRPTRAGLKAALADRDARRALASIIRRAKSESVGTEIADLTVCGAVAPYGPLVGGKLVSLIAVSPSAVRAYRKKYSDYAGEIASALAGRPIRRRSNLVFVGTTSLYGSSASQYNRLRLPGHVLEGSDDIRYVRLGKSRSFGTSHLSPDAVNALVRLSEESRTGVRVNSIFGEGVNPRLRKVREGLDLLGWPSDELLQHRRPRIVYGVPLVENLLRYLLGLDQRPKYLFQLKLENDVERITDWWFGRWLSKRVDSQDVMAEVRRHTLDRPVRHGARVSLPPSPDQLPGIAE